MPKYLVIGGYTAAGAAGVMKEGGTSRINAARQVIGSLGGSLESIYWGFGEDDFYAIVDMPSVAAVTAASLTISASGSLRVRTVPLITAEEMDAAAKLSPTFRPPGE